MKLKAHDWIALALMAALVSAFAAPPLASSARWVSSLVTEAVVDQPRYVNLRPTGDTLYLPLGEYTLWEADSLFTNEGPAWGATDPSQRRIVIERGMAPRFRGVVLGHELCHAKLRDSNVEYFEQEERVCDVLGGDLSHARQNIVLPER